MITNGTVYLVGMQRLRYYVYSFDREGDGSTKKVAGPFWRRIRAARVSDALKDAFTAGVAHRAALLKREPVVIIPSPRPGSFIDKAATTRVSTSTAGLTRQARDPDRTFRTSAPMDPDLLWNESPTRKWLDPSVVGNSMGFNECSHHDSSSCSSSYDSGNSGGYD
jgi:hypothetical protein